jgi:hypothetical protein
MPLPPAAEDRHALKPGAMKRQARKKRKKQQRISIARMQQSTPSRAVYVCIDWGASYWRQYTSVPGICTIEPSIAVYDTSEKQILTGRKASNMWLPSASHVLFENLKQLFDMESDFAVSERKRVQDLGLDINIEEVLESWWNDRLGSLTKRVSPQDTITVALAHPAHFSPRSVQSIRSFFERARLGRTFSVVVSEEATAALHGSRYSGFEAGDLVLVVDGGKSTIVRQHNVPRFRSNHVIGLRLSRNNDQRGFADDTDFGDERIEDRRRLDQPSGSAVWRETDRYT